jgi:hypothetical protein
MACFGSADGNQAHGPQFGSEGWGTARGRCSHCPADACEEAMIPDPEEKDASEFDSYFQYDFQEQEDESDSEDV